MDESDIFEDAAIDKINSIIVANTVRKKGYELMTKGYLCMLWVALLNYSSSTEDKKGENVYFSRDELRVSAARAFIEEKYSEYIKKLDDAVKDAKDSLDNDLGFTDQDLEDARAEANRTDISKADKAAAEEKVKELEAKLTQEKAGKTSRLKNTQNENNDLNDLSVMLGEYFIAKDEI